MILMKMKYGKHSIEPLPTAVGMLGLLGVDVAVTLWAAGWIGDSTSMTLGIAALGAIALLAAIGAVKPERHEWVTVLTKGGAATFLLVAWYTSFWHWCYGEQGWDQMHGDWGDWDSYQGDIPLWTLALAVALAVAVPREPAQDVAAAIPWWVTAGAVAWFTLALVVGGIIGNKGVPIGIMVACVVPVGIILWWWRQYTEAVVFIVVGLILDAALATDPVAYSDRSTIVQMVWCTVAGIAWVAVEVTQG